MNKIYKKRKINNNIFLLVTGNCEIISMSITRAFGHKQSRSCFSIMRMTQYLQCDMCSF